MCCNVRAGQRIDLTGPRTTDRDSVKVVYTLDLCGAISPFDMAASVRSMSTHVSAVESAFGVVVLCLAYGTTQREGCLIRVCTRVSHMTTSHTAYDDIAHRKSTAEDGRKDNVGLGLVRKDSTSFPFLHRRNNSSHIIVWACSHLAEAIVKDAQT